MGRKGFRLLHFETVQCITHTKPVALYELRAEPDSSCALQWRTVLFVPRNETRPRSQFPQFHFWEYLLLIFGTVPLRCTNWTQTECLLKLNQPHWAFNVKYVINAYRSETPIALNKVSFQSFETQHFLGWNSLSQQGLKVGVNLIFFVVIYVIRSRIQSLAWAYPQVLRLIKSLVGESL
jgi:hypothetical protein